MEGDVGSHGNQRFGILLELELQAIMSHLIWILVSGLKSTGSVQELEAKWTRLNRSTKALSGVER